MASRLLKSFFFALLALVALSGCKNINRIPDEQVFPAPGTIYGHDDRQDFHEVEDEAIKSLFHSVAIMTYDTYLDEQEDGSFILKPYMTYGKRYKLHQLDPMYGQPLAGFCSAFLVSETMIATAGHCVDNWDEEKMASIRFVFGFMMTDEDEPVLRFEANQVYSVSEIVSTEFNILTGNDYAVLRLDRPAEGIEPLSISRIDPLEYQSVFMIGHPNGAPMKLADDALVTSVGRYAFNSNLDVFSGNSGSPVFNMQREVVGILVRRRLYNAFDDRGYVDWTPNGQMRGRGNASIKVSIWRNYIQ